MPSGEEHTGRKGESPSPDASAMLPSASGAALPFRRRLVVPGIVLAILEICCVGYPLWAAFHVGELGADTMLRTVVPVAIGGVIVWWVAVVSWFLPLWQAVRARRRGERVHKELAGRAYKISLKGPVRVLLLRTGVWTVGAALAGLFLDIYDDWTPDRVAALVAIAAVHSYVVSCVRALWTAQVLGEVRSRLFASGSPLKKFDESHFRRFVLVAMIVAGGILAAQAAFAFYFMRLSTENYLQLEELFPAATAIGLVLWVVIARGMTSELRVYLAASRGEPVASPPAAALIYRRAQALPYRLAVLTICVWFVIALAGALVMRLQLAFALDDTLVLAFATLVLGVAGSIYEQLWHRDVLRPFLAHLTQRYRVPVRSIGPTLSLRSKLMLSFGGVVLLACGMALLWGFVQYKNLETKSAQDQAAVNLRGLTSTIQTDLGAQPTAPDETAVRASLRRIAEREPAAKAVGYYIGPSGELLAVGGGPKPPWYVRALIERADDSPIDMQGAFLTGRSKRLSVM